MMILTNELSGKKLKSLTPDDLYGKVVELCAEVKLLTGAVLYEDEKDLQLQMKTIVRFIASSPKFRNLTVPELRHAFYLNNQGELAEIHKHYNRELNAEFIGGVLSDYIKYKRPIYEKLPEIMYKLNPPAAPARLTAQELQVWIQQDYDNYRAGDLEYIFIPSDKYYYLRKIGFIVFTSKDKWYRWYCMGVDARRKEIAAGKASTFGARITKDKAISIYDAIKIQGIVPIPEHRAIIHAMRRLVYFKLFEVLKDTAINNIFSDIKIESK